jgi:hypothetical protein
MGVTADGRTFFVRGGSARGRAAASILSGRSESILAAKERGERLRLGGRDVGPYEASAVLPHWTATYEAMRLGRMTPDLRRSMNIGLLASHDEERYSFRYEIAEHGVGWPLICVRSLDPTPGSGRRDTFELPPWFYRNLPGVKMTIVPTRVVWRALAINTLLYALPWAFIFLGLDALARVRRLQSGRCPICRYDLRGSSDAGCPECGWGGKTRLADEGARRGGWRTRAPVGAVVVVVSDRWLWAVHNSPTIVVWGRRQASIGTGWHGRRRRPSNSDRHAGDHMARRRCGRGERALNRRRCGVGGVVRDRSSVPTIVSGDADTAGRAWSVWPISLSLRCPSKVRFLDALP